MVTKNIASYILARPRHRLLLAVLTGLILGWLLLNFWLQPAHEASMLPQTRRVEDPTAAVQAVADAYWRTRDLSQAQGSLAPWDANTLRTAIDQVMERAPSFEKYHQLAVLRAAVGLPEAQQSLLAFLLRQGSIRWSIAVALLPLLVALGVAIPFRHRLSSKNITEPLLQSVEPQELNQMPSAPVQTAELSPQATQQDNSQETVVVREVAPEEAVADSPPVVAQQADQPVSPEEQEMPAEQIAQAQSQLGQVENQLKVMQDRLQHIQKLVPQMQHPLNSVQEQIRQTQNQLVQFLGSMPQMSPHQAQGELEQIQTRLEEVQQQMWAMVNQLPEDTPPEVRVELEQLVTQMQQQVAQMQQQLLQLKQLTRQSPPGQPSSTQPPSNVLAEEEKAPEADLPVDLSLDDVLTSVFEGEETIDPHLLALSQECEEIDVLDLAAQSKVIVNQLRKVLYNE